jgi:metallo-beta-lactamase family protein
MKLSFHGAARTVTGSKHILTTDTGKKILLDCGLFQGKGKESDALNRTFGFNPSEISCLILSHAHIDHSGAIPLLYKQGYRGPIYCTHATLDLCKIMLIDSAHIQENDILYINKQRAREHKELLKPLYTIKDATESLTLFEPLELNKEYELLNGIYLTFTFVGHILGSAAINLKIIENNKTTRICYTGDIGRRNQQIIKNPEPFPQADYIITEATYGDRIHEEECQAEKRLLDIISETCIKNKGKLIIPAFSLGRTQEIVYALDKLENKGLLPHINVYVDSPLSTNATEIVRKHTEYFNKEICKYIKEDPNPFGFNRLYYIRDQENSKALNKLKEPCIIISASGMMEAGRIKHHLANNIENPKNTILVVGYCEPSTLGGRIVAGAKTVKIFGQDYQVNAKVEVMDSYSAHGDYKEMMEYLSCQNINDVKKIFLVHGNYDVQVNYKEHLLNMGFKKIIIPDMHTEHILD